MKLVYLKQMKHQRSGRRYVATPRKYWDLVPIELREVPMRVMFKCSAAAALETYGVVKVEPYVIDVDEVNYDQ